MDIRTGDISIRKDGGIEAIWVSSRLLETEFGISTYLRAKARPSYKKTVPATKRNQDILPDTGKAWRWAKIHGGFYYDLNRIPDKAPKFYRSQLPSSGELIEMATGETQTQADPQSFIDDIFSEITKSIDSNDIDYFIYKASYNFTPKAAGELAMALAFFKVVKTWFESKKYKAYNLNASGFWQNLSERLNKMGYEGLNYTKAAALRKKVLYDAPKSNKDLVSGRYGNQNRRVVGKDKVVNTETGELMNFDIHEALIYNAWMNFGKANKLHKTGEVSVTNQYKQKCSEFGFDPVADRTVAHYLNRFPNKAMMSMERDGKDHFTNTYKPYIPAFRTQFAGSMWVADFSGSKLLYKYMKESWSNGKKIRKWTTASWYLLRITDVATDNIVGYHMTESGERWQDIAIALGRAIKNSNGYAAYELVTDNGPSFTSSESKAKLARLFQKHRRIGIGNKQANRAELYVRLLSDCAREFENWSMLGFASKHIDNQANPDYMDMDKLPTQSEAIEQIEQLIEKWNNSPRPDGSIPAIEYAKESRRSPKIKPVEQKLKRYLFATHTISSLTRCRGILELRQGDQAHKFTFPNWEQDAIKIDDATYGQNTDLKVKVVWDFKAADIYTLDDRYIMTIKASVLSHPTEAEATAISGAALEAHTASKKHFENRAGSFTENILETVDAIHENHNGHGVPVVAELTYLQRASLNGGRAKEEHNRVMNDFNNEAPPDDAGQDFLTQL